MAIKIVTDSTCDLPRNLAEELRVSIVPLKVLFGEEVYRDGIDLSNAEFYAKMAQHKELPTTAQVNPGEFSAEFLKHLENGDEIIGIFISAKLSGTYSSAVIAKESLAGKGSIYLVDSKSATIGLGMLVIQAARMAREGKSAQEIVRWLENARERIIFYGIINNLENLKKGGRLSSTAALAGNLLGIKPIITLQDGAVTVAGKARGQKKAYCRILEEAQSKTNLDQKMVCIAHAAAPAELLEFKQKLLEKCKPQELIEFEIGSVIGTHTGAGCIGFCCLE
ncbi:MAG TPA: DegV family protein [Peptococcaceae bacterium]|nr:DegV family protein [Peptococcaceae bacterium]